MKKAAIICALVCMISIVPAFALNQTANNTGAQIQNQSGTCDQTQSHDHDKKQIMQKNGTQSNCTACDGDQNKYQYGIKNSANTNTDNQYKYQYGIKNSENSNTDNQYKYQNGLKNGASVTNCVKNTNCIKA